MAKLTQTDSLSLGDWITLWKTNQGDWRGYSISDFLAWLQGNLVFPDEGMVEPTTQYAAPAASGFSIPINAGTEGTNDVHLIITPAAGYADGEIVLPLSASCRDKQKVIVNCTQQIDAVVVDGNGASGVYGAPSAIGADDFFTLKFDVVLQSWFRIG